MVENIASHLPEEADIVSYLPRWVRRSRREELLYDPEYERSTALVHCLPDGVIWFSASGTVEAVNPACERLTGYTRVELMNTALWTSLFPTDADDRWSPDLVPSRAKIQRRDGAIIDVSVQHIRPFGMAGAVALIIREIESDHRDMLLREAEKRSAAGELAAGIAHEIKNPLTALKGFTRLLEEGAAPTALSYLDIMTKELERIESIVKELLVLTKPSMPVIEPHNPVDILQDVLNLLQAQANWSNIRWNLQAEAGISKVCCDANQMKQVLVNVLQNAMEAMPTGGELELRVCACGDSVEISCTDHGDGIPEDILRKLGQPFCSSKSGGTGLGVMVSRQIVENHGGQMLYESVVGEGTTVRILLPHTC